jgi:hypothetical protein
MATAARQGVWFTGMSQPATLCPLTRSARLAGQALAAGAFEASPFFPPTFDSKTRHG